MTGEEFAAEYEILVQRYPTETNAMLAARLRMNVRTFETYARRGRRAGLITIWRYGHGREVDIAPEGVRSGGLPSITDAQRRVRARVRASRTSRTSA